MTKLSSNGLSIEVEEYGDRSDPPVLLIMGFAAQLTLWPPTLIASLVENGFRVIAFDNRDIGLSEKLDSLRAHDPSLVALMNTVGLASLFAPYKLTDMAKDTAGVLDALEIERAHVVGASMGGMIGQIVAAQHPGRTKSFTAIMSSTNNPHLPKAEPHISKEILTARTRQRGRDELIDRTMRIWDLIGTKDSGRDPAEFRAQVAAGIDRNTSPEGIRRQLAAIIATRDLREWTRRITAPSLIIHGSDDPLVPFQCGQDIAATIKHARLEVIEGMGHDLPPRLLPTIARHLISHLNSVENGSGNSKTSNRAA